MNKNINIALILSLISFATIAQDEGTIYNTGDEITVPMGQDVYVKGGYVDNSGATLTNGQPSTGTLVNGDTIYFSGDFENNSPNAINVTDFGTVTLNGNKIQIIKGANSILFHNLFLEKDTSVVMYQIIDVTDSLVLTQGFINIDSAVAGVNLGNAGTMYGENNTNYFHGVLGSITATNRALSGVSNNIAGTGLSLDVNGSLGVSNIERKNGHQAGASDGGILRFYTITPGNTGMLNSASIQYLGGHELNGLDETALALWQSNNNGVVWNRQTTALFPALDSVSASNLDVLSSTIVLTLADSICDVVPIINLPDTTVVCTGTIVELDAKNPGLFFLWSTGETTQKINIVNAATYSVLVTDANGCVAADTVVLVEKSFPVVNFGLTPVCQKDSSMFSNTSTIDEGALVYKWDFGVANNETDTSIIAEAKYLYDTTGLYEVVLRATSDFGCVAYDTLDYLVHPLPEPAFDFANICLQQANIFTDQSQILGNIGSTNYAISSYSWDFGDEGIATDISTLQSPTYVYEADGNYTITLALESNAGCKDTIQHTVEVHPLAQVDFSLTSVCTGNDISLANLSTLSSGSMTFAWNFGDTNTSTDENPEKIYSTPNNYTVMLEATTDSLCVTSVSKTVDSYANPIAGFTLANACTNSDIQLSNTSTITSADALTYLWNFADGNTSTDANPIKNYTQADDYSIQLIVTSAQQCKDSTVIEVAIHPEPTANFNFVNTCQDDEIKFFNQSAIASGTVTYNWDFADGNNATAQNPTNTYTTDGTFDVILEVLSGENCTANITKTVESFPLPILTIPSVINTCGSEFILDAENVGSSYSWSDNSTGQTLTVTSSGNYSVQVITVNGCRAEATTTVGLDNVFTPNLEDTAVACDRVTLDGGNQGAQSYLWSTGETTQTIEVSTSGQYTIDIVDQNGCPGSDVIDVTIHSSPTIDLGLDAAFCSDQSVVLDAENVGSTFMWTTGEATQTLDITTSGTYGVTITNSEGCFNSDEINIIINPIPIVDLGEDGMACDEISLDAGNEGATYLWSDGSTNQTFNTITSGTYSVTVTDANGCSASDEVVLEIVPNPVFDLGSDPNLCSGESITLDVGNEGATYTWSNGETTQSIEVSATGSYAVVVTNSLGCAVEDEVFITVHSLLQVDLGDDLTTCKGQNVEADAGLSGDYTYQWMGASSGFSATTQVVSLTESDKYSVTVTDQFGCTGIDSLLLQVSNDTLNSRFLAVSEAFVGDTVVFINISFPDSVDFLWNFDDGIISSKEDEEHIFLKEGIFNVSLLSSNIVCSDISTKQITITELPAGGRVTRVSPLGEDTSKPVDPLISNIYPNPSKGVFVLDVKMTEEKGILLQMMNMNGFLMYEEHFDNILEMNKQFDLSAYARGLYLLKITSADQSKVMRLLKN